MENTERISLKNSVPSVPLCFITCENLLLYQNELQSVESPCAILGRKEL